MSFSCPSVLRSQARYLHALLFDEYLCENPKRQLGALLELPPMALRRRLSILF